MKISTAYLASAFLSLAALPALAAQSDIVCADWDAEGGELKVDFVNNVICVNGGAPTADFCTNQWAKSYPIVRQSEGSVVTGGKTYQFIEVVAQSEFVPSELQIVRMYKDVIGSVVGGGHTYTQHHTDLTGALWAASIAKNPLAAFAEGEAYCTDVAQ